MSKEEFMAAAIERFGLDDLSEILPALEWVWENYHLSPVEYN